MYNSRNNTSSVNRLYYNKSETQSRKRSISNSSVPFIKVAREDQTWSKLEQLYKLGKQDDQNLEISFRNKEIEEEVEAY
jgi:hypothetical protein